MKRSKKPSSFDACLLHASRMESISMTMCSESMGTSSKIEMTSFASSYRPFCTSHLGDSGNKRAERAMMAQNTKGIDSGNLQQIELCCWKENPKLIQAARDTPEAMKIPMTTTLFPRFLGLEHSACQTGTTALTPPTPRPETMRPTTSCPRVNDEPCRIVPIAAIMENTTSARRRPSGFPTYVDDKAPMRHPRV